MMPHGATPPMLLAALLALANTAGATSVAPRSLEEIATDAYHALAGRVVAVDMVDGGGRPLHDPDARTGPGLPNRLFFVIEVDEVIATRCRRPPSRIRVPLWSMWHYSLGDMREVEGSDGIFLLAGPGFEPAYFNGFQRAADERAEIEAVFEAKRLADAPPRPIHCREAPRR